MSSLYLIASLPMLSLDAAPGVTPGAFLAACREQLGAADAEAAEALLAGRPLAHPFVEAWTDKEALLRNAAARQRARASGGDAARWLRPAQGCDTRIEAGVEEAFQEGDPLKREKALDRLRWTLLDELQGCDPLSVRVVFAYAAKLALAARRAALDPAKGSAVFDTLTAKPIPPLQF
ncbi:MAG: DUF2764 family protein [Verrucomicrobiota bacterium]|jgi:hypothetical protein|nr:DUF2764 family protein [Verrucomicrobiota bacterium]